MRYEEVTLSGERRKRIYGGSPWHIQKYLMDWEAANPRPQPPAKKKKTADGTEETFVLRRDPAYLAAMDVWRAEREVAKDIPLVVNALKDELPDDETLWRGEWTEAFARLGIELSQDKARRQYEYLRSEIMLTDLDVAIVGMWANVLTFPQEEAVKAAMRGFQSSSTASLWSRLRMSIPKLLSRGRGTSTPE